MKKYNFIVIAIFVGMVGMLILISGLFDKKEIPRDEIQMAEETPTSDTTTTTTTTTTKKVVKTTQKTTKKVQDKFTKVATASKAEYMAYAKSYGNLNDTQLTCLDYLWTHESNWNPNSYNSEYNACGIPQSRPCNKIKKQQGSYDWQSQIRWGLNYIMYKYKNPCSAWNQYKNSRPHGY